MATRNSTPLARGRAKAVMADTPLFATGMAEQAGRRQEEQPPPPAPQARIAAVDVVQNPVDLWTVGVEIRQPGFGRSLIVRPVPTPLLLDLEDVREAPDQAMARHDAAGEEMAGDP